MKAYCIWQSIQDPLEGADRFGLPSVYWLQTYQTMQTWGITSICEIDSHNEYDWL